MIVADVFHEKEDLLSIDDGNSISLILIEPLCPQYNLFYKTNDTFKMSETGALPKERPPIQIRVPLLSGPLHHCMSERVTDVNAGHTAQLQVNKWLSVSYSYKQRSSIFGSNMLTTLQVCSSDGRNHEL
jgi:hypothetical protein